MKLFGKPSGDGKGKKDTFKFADLDFPMTELPLRACVLGAPKTGKSSLMKRTGRSLVEKGVSLVVIDNSGEMVNYYKAHSPPGMPVRSISMEYADGVGLNLGKALVDPINRRLFAKLMSEDINASESRARNAHPFFTKMSEIVTSNAIKCLTITAGEDFFLADIVRLVTFPALHEYFCKVANVKNPYDNFGESDSRRDTAVTLVSHFEPLASFAAVDMRAETRIDLPINDGVFVVEWSYRSSACINPITSFLAEYLIAQRLSKQSNEQMMFMCDELRLINRISGLIPLAGAGRKSGLGFLLSLHSINGLIHLYSRELALEILGLCDYRVFLRSACFETAKFASQQMGATEVTEHTMNYDNNWSATVKERLNVTPSQIRHILQDADPVKDRIEGYLDGPRMARHFVSSFLDDVRMPRDLPERPRLKAKDLELQDFELMDMERLGVKVTSELIEILEGKKETTARTRQSKKGESP